MSKDLNLLLAGFGGQGLLFGGKVVAYAGLMEGREISWLPSYGPEMRGGTANCSVCVSDAPIGSPLVLNPNVLVAMNLPSLKKFENDVVPGGIILVDSAMIDAKVERTDVKVFYVPATKWDQSGARFEYDFEKFTEAILEEGGDVDLIVLGPGVFDTMLENEFYLKSLDLRAADLGELQTRYAGQGIYVRGVTRNGTKMVTDVAKFRNDDGEMEYEIPYGHILLGSTVNKPLKIKHGPITKVKGEDDNARHETYVKKEVPFRIGDSDNDTITNRLVSCPTIIPENVGAWGVMKVL